VGSVLYRDHDVDIDPMIVLACGHIMTRDSLDEHMGLRNFYETNASGESQSKEDEDLISLFRSTN